MPSSCCSEAAAVLELIEGPAQPSPAQHIRSRRGVIVKMSQAQQSHTISTLHISHITRTTY